MKGINNNHAIKTANGNFIARNPIAASAIAVALIATPVAAFGVSGMFSNASEMDGNGLEASYNMPGGDQESTVAKESVSLTDNVKVEKKVETKTVKFNTEGPGHIEPAENCTIDGEGRTITIEDASKAYAFKIVADNENVTDEITVGGERYEADNGVVKVEADKSDGEVLVVYTDQVAKAQAEEAAKAAAAAQAEAAKAAAASKPATTAAPARTQSAPAATQSAPAAQAPAPAPAPATNGTAAPASGQVANSMTADELACAKDIFNAYNAYRASKGLSQVAWSDDCANMAYQSAKGCAQRGSLTHRLGIPAAVQGNYSDILQYSSWRMSGSEAVGNWQGSTGHRRMMQCDSASVAAVGAYNNGGVWYYAIVYNFSGTNQSGN